MTLIEAAEQLIEYQQNGKIYVILHHAFVDDLNDSEDELTKLIDYVNEYFKDIELEFLDTLLNS